MSALALNPDGKKEVLGLWVKQTEGAKFWLKVINDLKTRGYPDCGGRWAQGLSRGDRLGLSADRGADLHRAPDPQQPGICRLEGSQGDPACHQGIYRAENADMALVRLEEFEDEWGKRYPAIGQAWRRAWEHVVPFFAFAPGVRKMIYTTNAVEALHRSLRKIIKTRGSFPNDDAALKLLYLAIKNAGLRWRRGVEWTAAMGQFAIQFGPRFPGSTR